MKIKKSSISVVAFLTFYICLSVIVRAENLPAHFNGITLDAAQLLTADERDLKPEEIEYRNRTKNVLESLPTRTIVRVVFDTNTEAGEYKSALDYLRSLKMPDGKRKIYIMGELLDSDFLAQYRWDCKKSEGCTKDEDGENFHDYKSRINSYLKDLDERVDIWEVGNEVNGEWVDEGCVKNPGDGCFSDKDPRESGEAKKSKPERNITAKKIAYAVAQAVAKKKPIALTLIHQPECTTWDKNAMFVWTRDNLRSLINKYKIDYLLISYYEDNCDNGTQTIAPESSLTEAEKRTLSEKEKDQRRRDIYWTQTFNDLEKLFSKVDHIGFGEVGYSSDMKTCEGDVMAFCKDGVKAGLKLDLLNRYYGMRVNNPKYIGGHFWWTAQEDITYKDFYSSLADYFKKNN
jgi:hypothetical protein